MSALEFKVEYTQKALKFMESIAKKEAVRLYKKIGIIKSNPIHYIEKLTSVDLWKLRVGDFRIIIRLNRGAGVISVVDIGHRRNVYKRL